jgi:hypothetical protein
MTNPFIRFMVSTFGLKVSINVINYQFKQKGHRSDLIYDALLSVGAGLFSLVVLGVAELPVFSPATGFSLAAFF